MADFRLKLNRSAVRDLLRSPEMLADLTRRANRIAEAAGSGMDVDSNTGKGRARATVRTASAEARQREATDHALTSSIDAGR